MTSQPALASTAHRRSLAEAGIALGPLDGRYRAAVEPLVEHLSEAALNRNRIHVEVEWFIHLAEHRVLPGLEPLTAEQQAGLRAIVTDFDAESVAELAATEKVTVHDVKAVEYFIADRLEGLGLGRLKPLVHFACTSEDINNLAYAVGVRDAVEQVWLPAARAAVATVSAMAAEAAETPMLSRTHGQPATPTTLGKEMAVFVHRLTRQTRRIAGQEYLGKINGATGTYAAHLAAAPDADWPALFWFPGYLGEPEKTAERFTPDGRWYLTGDTARQDDDGWFFFSSRDDDVILAAGYRIGPFDVESVLIDHPRVQEVAVVGLPDPEGVRGEEVVAFVVPAGAVADPDALAAELQAKVRDEYSKHAYPRRVHFVDRLPKTPSGKLQRFLLRQGAAG